MHCVFYLDLEGQEELDEKGNVGKRKNSRRKPPSHGSYLSVSSDGLSRWPYRMAPMTP